MSHKLFVAAFHLYALGAVPYLLFLVRPAKVTALLARGVTGAGFLMHAVGLFLLLRAQGGVLQGMGQGLSAVTFLLLSIYFVLDAIYRLPVLGAFLSPMALTVWALGLWLPLNGEAAKGTTQLLPFHISVALLGVAAFAMAAAVAAVFLLMERQVKGKHFGLLFARLPSLQSLDELNRLLVLAGFIALSLTLVTGAFLPSAGTFLKSWHSREIATVTAWGLFALVLNARLFAGWRGRRVALLTMAGFCVLVVSFITTYGAGSTVRSLP